MISNVVSQLANQLISKKEELIKMKLAEKGFGHLIEGMYERRFPKVCAVKQGNWTLYFADNDTPEGAFIVAIEEAAPTFDNWIDHDRDLKLNLSFNWQDSYPGIISLDSLPDAAVERNWFNEKD